MKGVKKRIVFILLLIIMVLAICSQAYASVNGYDNIYFMIKDLKIAKANSNDEIFNDNEILLSYKYFEITKDIKIQVNKVEIEKGNSVFYINVKNNNKENEMLPFHYIVRIDKKYEDGYIPVLRPESSNTIYKGKEDNSNNYLDTISVPYVVGEDEIVTIELLDKNDFLIRNISINFEKHEIEVTGEKDEIAKISQIEFNKYLSAYALLNDESNNMDKLSRYIYIGSQLQTDIPEIRIKEGQTDREFENSLANSITSEELEMEKTKTKDGKEVSVLKIGKGYFVYDNELDAYICDFENVKIGQCLKINDIYFKDGIYTVDYIYIIKSSEDIMKDRVEELPQKNMTLKLRLNENTDYAKYQILFDKDSKNELEKATVNQTDNTIENTIDNKTTSDNENLKEAKITVEYDEKNDIVNENEVTNPENVEESLQEQDNSKERVENAKTGDNIWIYIIFVIISTGSAYGIKRIKKNIL